LSSLHTQIVPTPTLLQTPDPLELASSGTKPFRNISSQQNMPPSSKNTQMG